MASVPSASSDPRVPDSASTMTGSRVVWVNPRVGRSARNPVHTNMRREEEGVGMFSSFETAAAVLYSQVAARRKCVLCC